MKLLFFIGLLPYVFCAGGIVGGLTDQKNPEKDAGILAATNFALEQMNGLLDSDPQMSKISIVSAKTQVVSGINYYLTLRVKYGDEVKECNVVVYSQPWTQTTQMTSQTCVDERKKMPRTLLGGIMPATMDKEAKEALSYAIKLYNQRSNNLFKMLPTTVTNVSKQIVNGVLYRFETTVQKTNCRNDEENKDKGLDECPPENGGITLNCKFSVLQQDWEKTKLSLRDFDCENRKAKVQTLLGGDGTDLCHLTHFDAFKNEFGKSYETTMEEKKRFKIFCENMKKARKLQEIEQSTAIYGPTVFSDLTEKEFRLRLNPEPWNLDYRPDTMVDAEIPNVEIPESFDWRDHGAVTPVKNQGSCGSCWAFSTTGNIEGQWAIKRKQLISLSEQELVDCDKVDQGCNGGLPSQAYEAIMKLGGLETETEYSYKGYNEKCFFNKTDVAAKISGSVKISQDEKAIAAWLYKNGPISIGINAFPMQFYRGGISHPWKIFCNPKKLDHGVLIVGYGVEKDVPYWIIKNSWGPSWGEKGYYYVYRGAGVCGLNTMCTSATVN